MLIEAILSLFTILLLHNWYRHVSRVNIPRLGPPTIFGYLWTLVRVTRNSKVVMDEGRLRFGGRPYILPTLGAPFVVVGQDNMEVLRNDDAVFSQPAAILEGLALHHTIDDHVWKNRYEETVMRTDVTRALHSIIPGVVEETKLAIDEMCSTADPVTITVFDTMTQIVSRVSNRALVGVELCRNTKYTRTMVNFAVTLMMHAYVLKFFPKAVRHLLYYGLSQFIGGKKEALVFLIPYAEECVRNKDKLEDGPVTITDFMVRAAPPDEIANPQQIAKRLLVLNFGGIYPLSLLMTQALFSLALYPADNLEKIREQIRQALVAEDGWNKESIAKFHKLDSLLREIGRVYGVAVFGLNRRTITTGKLPDGTIIPPGYTVVVDMQSVHMNPGTYPNPEVLDPFRFSKYQEQEGADAKYAFPTVDKNYLLFGLGRHACPGRFFGSMELKVMLAYVLLNYDFAFPAGIKDRPKNLSVDASVIPNPQAKLVFTKRQATTTY